MIKTFSEHYENKQQELFNKIHSDNRAPNKNERELFKHYKRQLKQLAK